MKKKLPVLATLGRVVKEVVKELYQSMGYSMILSIIWSVAAMPPIILFFANLGFFVQTFGETETFQSAASMFIVSLVMISLWNGLVTGPVTTALFGMNQERKTDYIGIKTFFRFFKTCYGVSCRVHLLFSLGLTVMVVNFFIAMAEPGLFFRVAGLFSLYVMFFVGLMAIYFQPLIYYKHNVTNVFRKAFLLLVDNFVLTFLLGLVIGIMWMISIPTVIILLLIFGGFYIYLADQSFEIISEKYESSLDT